MASVSASTTGTKAPKNDMLKSIKSFFGSGSGNSGKKVNLTINPVVKLEGSTAMEIEKEEELIVVDDDVSEQIEADDDDVFEDAEQGSLFERMIDLSNKMEMGPNRFLCTNSREVSPQWH